MCAAGHVVHVGLSSSPEGFIATGQQEIQRLRQQLQSSEQVAAEFQQLVAGGGLGQSGQCEIDDIQFQEEALQFYRLGIVNLQLRSHGPQDQETAGS